jgi:hypothetical protein
MSFYADFKACRPVVIIDQLSYLLALSTSCRCRPVVSFASPVDQLSVDQLSVDETPVDELPPHQNVTKIGFDKLGLVHRTQIRT